MPRLDEPPNSLERRKKDRKRGRRVANEQAVRPIPVSAVDQIATSVVAYRKSAWLARSLTYGMRTIVAMEALRMYLLASVAKSRSRTGRIIEGKPTMLP